MGTDLSPALLGVGYIVGLNVGIAVVSGSILSFNIAIPSYHESFMGTDPAPPASVAGASAQDIAGAIWPAPIRYAGWGTMRFGRCWTLVWRGQSLATGCMSRVRPELQTR